jgi:hypothetical protein
MFLLLAASLGYPPEFVVENKMPAFTVTNRMPAVVVSAKNGFNCGASFCGANSGSGCPSCPNGVGGKCVCGPKAAVVTAAPVEAPPVTYALPFAAQSCPNGQCGNAVEGRRGLFGWRR